VSILYSFSTFNSRCCRKLVTNKSGVKQPGLGSPFQFWGTRIPAAGPGSRRRRVSVRAARGGGSAEHRGRATGLAGSGTCYVGRMLASPTTTSIVALRCQTSSIKQRNVYRLSERLSQRRPSELRPGRALSDAAAASTFHRIDGARFRKYRTAVITSRESPVCCNENRNKCFTAAECHAFVPLVVESERIYGRRNSATVSCRRPRLVWVTSRPLWPVLWRRTCR